MPAERAREDPLRGLSRACLRRLRGPLGTRAPAAPELRQRHVDGYGLERIYKEQATAIELVCAAPYLTSMILMSMENRRKRGAEDPSVFDEKAHMARHRFGARGNVITFPLPMEELLQKLREPNPEHDDLSVPRSGHQLAQMFRVILKTNKHGRNTEEELKTLIHQATVRREARASARLGSSRFLARWW